MVYYDEILEPEVGYLHLDDHVLSSAALYGLSTYDDIVASLREIEGFKDYFEIKNQLSADGFKTYDDTKKQLSDDGFKTYDDTKNKLVSEGIMTYDQLKDQLSDDGFKTYDDTKKQLSDDGFKTYDDTKKQLSNDGYLTKMSADHDYQTKGSYLTQESLNGYATESWINNQNYATTSWVNNQNYMTDSDIQNEGYSKVSISEVATTGSKIAKLTINGYPTTIYAPAASQPITPGDGTVTIYQNGAKIKSFTMNQNSNTDIYLTDTTSEGVTIGNGTITIKQGDDVKGTFTLNQSSNLTVNLDAGDGEPIANAASLSDVMATIIEFDDGSISSFEWKGEINKNTSINAGIRTQYSWSKKPVAVKIGSSVTSLGINAFSGCTELTNIIIPTSVSSIGNAALNACSKLTNIIIQNSVVTVGDSICSQCTNLKKIIYPTSLTSAGQSDFCGCDNLEEIFVEGKTQAEAETILFPYASPLRSKLKTWPFVEEGLPSSLSTDLSSDIALGVQKLPTGNAIAQYMQMAFMPMFINRFNSVAERTISSWTSPTLLDGINGDAQLAIIPEDGFYYVRTWSADTNYKVSLYISLWNLDKGHRDINSNHGITLFNNEITLGFNGAFSGQTRVIENSSPPMYLEKDCTLYIVAKTSKTTAPSIRLNKLILSN